MDEKAKDELLWYHGKNCRLCNKEIYPGPKWVYKDEWGIYCSWKCFRRRFDGLTKNENTTLENVPDGVITESVRQKWKHKERRKMDQYTLDGVFVKSYENSDDAALAVGGTPNAICQACRRGLKYNGYLWRYRENELS